MLVLHLATDEGAHAAARLGARLTGNVRYRPVSDIARVLAAVDDVARIDRAHVSVIGSDVASIAAAVVGVVPLEDSHDGLCAATVDGLAFDTESVLVMDEVDIVSDETHNGSTRRWVAVATTPAIDPTDPQTLLFVIPQLNRPGTLLEMLAAFSSRGLNLTRFGTRPLHGAIGMYGFLMEVEGSPVDEWVADALADVLGASSHLKFLGTFPAGERMWSQVTGRLPAGRDLRTLQDLDALVTGLDLLRDSEPVEDPS